MTRTVTITVHLTLVDDDCQSWDVSDNGGEFDNASHDSSESAADDANSRHDHYVHQDPDVRVVTENT